MRSRQRGAYSFLFLVLLVAGGMLIFALAADGARLYAQQRVLQQHADAVAQAAAMNIQTCGGEGASIEQVCLAAQAFATRNDLPVSVACDDIDTGLLEPAGDGLYAFTPAPFTQSNSVRVSLQQVTPRSLLLPGRVVGNANLSAEATARRELVGTFSSSPETLSLGVEEASLLNGLLTEVLGLPVGLGLLDYRQLREATAGLGDLLGELAALGVGDATLETLLGSEVPADLLILALSRATESASPAGSILDSLLVGGGLDLVSVEEIFEVVTPADIPEGSRLPVYDVLMSVVLNLAESLLIDLPVDISLPGLVGVSARLMTDEAPRVALGPARQDSNGNWVTSAPGADIRIQLQAELDLNLTILGTGVRAGVLLPLNVSTGTARGDFVSATCARGMSNVVHVGVDARTAVAEVQGAADVGVRLSLLGIPITLAGLRLVVDLPVGAGTDLLLYPPMDLHDTEHETMRAGQRLNLSDLGSGAIRIEGTANPIYSCGLICGLVNGLLWPIVALLNVTLFDALLPLIGAVLEAALDPLFRVLGIELGTASITVTDVQQSQPIVVRTID